MFPEFDEDDESELTSIMSAEERSLLQESTRGEDVQRPTARPQKAADPVDPSLATPRPPGAEAAEATPAVVIPKAPLVPGAAAARSSTQAKATEPSPAPAASRQAATPAPAASRQAATPAPGVGATTVVPFLLLAVAIAFVIFRG